jgi:hypothetical protein
MTQHIDQASETNAYDVIPVVLFVISLILMIFTVAVIFIVYFGQKAAENNELREARRVAEQSSAAKSEFLANMSHEIRTPINAVMGMNEIILRESTQARKHLPEDSEQIRGIFADISSYAGIINNAGKNLLSIINDILDFSKIEAGRLELIGNAYELSLLLSDVSNLISFRAKEKGLDYLLDVDERIPEVLFGDKVRVRLTIKADQDYDFVQITDKRAACLEPVDVVSGYRNGCYRIVKDNATYFYADRLRKGTTVLETEYYVDRPGKYETGSCTVQCVYAPAFSARTSSISLSVESPSAILAPRN